MTQTIALIDDDRNILTSISIALEKEGFKVQTYLDGESALIGLSRNPPDFETLFVYRATWPSTISKNPDTNNATPPRIREYSKPIP